MKIEEKLNAKKIIAESKKNQKELGSLFEELEVAQLTKKDEKNFNSQIEEMEQLALSIKGKLDK